ncbi:hypothetical protein RBLE17_18180 [Rhodobacteraceae bacterium LE17]|jgi:hypothetical protein|nr:hypothetical protein [Rhodobacteraceae bacterium LE17]
MYQPKYFNHFVLSIEAAIQPDTILYIERYNDPLYGIKAKQYRISAHPDNDWESTRVFVFDYFSRPITKMAQILHSLGAEIVFVQHGSLTQVDHEIQVGSKRLFLKRLMDRVLIIAQIMLFALRARCTRFLFSYPRDIRTDYLSAAYIFLEQDSRYFTDIAERCFICASENSFRFQTDPEAGNVFISQPLIEDCIVNCNSYLSLFDHIVRDHDIRCLIAHPRDKILAEHARKKGLNVYGLKDKSQHSAAAVVGHFSSLLFEIRGMKVCRLSYSTGEEIDRFQTTDYQERPLITDALRNDYGPQSVISVEGKQ